jgi:Skp family chaperone for outer membrane proteins
MGVRRGKLLTITIALAAILASATPGAMRAQELGRVVSPILTIDRDRLFSGTLYGQRVNRELEEASQAMAAETRAIEQALEEEEQQLTELRQTMPADEFRVLAAEFDEKVQSLRIEREQAESALRARIEAEQNQFFDQIGPILGAVVRARGAVMIIDRRAVLLTAADVDITEDAIAQIDGTLGDGDAATAPPDDTLTAPEAPVVDTIPVPETDSPDADGATGQ